MSDQINTEKLLAFTRYLSWADLQRTLFDEEMNSERDTDDPEVSRDHEWRSFGLMSYWYASLYVVVEAWDKLGLVDPIVDRLLSDSRDLRKLLRRYRNAIFHFQESVVSPKITEFLKFEAVQVHWMWALHDEMVRAFASHLERLVVTDDQRRELREDIQSMFNWYPYRAAKQIESLQRTLARAREMLRDSPDDGSDERQSLEQIVEASERALQEGRPKWEQFRSQILRDAGIE